MRNYSDRDLLKLFLKQNHNKPRYYSCYYNYGNPCEEYCYNDVKSSVKIVDFKNRSLILPYGKGGKPTRSNSLGKAINPPITFTYVFTGKGGTPDDKDKWFHTRAMEKFRGEKT
uniref:Uncharacterized protein n=1 Tax=viral metagenome TaxID=1070528 RepID=A0A6C0JV88_9ZZZZ